MSSTLSSPWTSSSPVSLPVTTTSFVRDIEADIREFWSSFPCPPPWRPHLLIEVNASRLEPRVSRTVQTFLAGKCDIQHVLIDPDLSGHQNPRDSYPDLDFRPTDSSDPVSSLGDPATSSHSWCDTACQLSIGCAIFFVVVAMTVAVLICITKHRVRHKMASTRPSRQQLQLSTSTSDAVNCTDFSNLEIQGDDDIVFPPFRNRGLPHPPMSCHPHCDTKWNCTSCSPCHPLMRLSPPGQYYSRAYSAVYETIDDDDDDVPRCEGENCHHPRAITHVPVNLDARNTCNACIPCQVSPTSVSTVRLRPLSGEVMTTESQQMAETGFNGEDNSQQALKVSALTKYFELEQESALTGQRGREPEVCNHDSAPRNANPNSQGECHNLAFSHAGPLMSPVTYQYSNLAGSPLHSYVLSQVQHKVVPSASEFYRAKSDREAASSQVSAESQPQGNSYSHGDQSHSHPRHPEGGSHAQQGGHNCFNNVPNHQSIHGLPCHASSTFSPIPTTAATSTFPTDSPAHYLCHSCQYNQAADQLSPPLPSAAHLVQDSDHVSPDLIAQTSNHSRRDSASWPDPAEEENNEVPLRKPVLALHSHYFAKTSAA